MVRDFDGRGYEDGLTGRGVVPPPGSRGGYALAQPFFLFALLQAFLERGVSIWWPISDLVVFFCVDVPAFLPAFVVGVVDRVVVSVRRNRWIAPLRVDDYCMMSEYSII